MAARSEFAFRIWTEDPQQPVTRRSEIGEFLHDGGLVGSFFWGGEPSDLVWELEGLEFCLKPN